MAASPSPGRAGGIAAVLTLAVVLVAAVLVTLFTDGTLGRPSAGPQNAGPTEAPSAETGSVVGSSPPPRGAGMGGVGQRVFLRDCAWCHGIEGTGTGRGPSLLDAGGAEVDFQLRTGRMPLHSPDEKAVRGRAEYSSGVIRSLVHYVSSLGLKGEPVPTMTEGDVRSGRKLFVESCAPCHSSSGTGMILPDGTFAPELFPEPPRQVAEAIRIGPGPMPAFGSSTMSDGAVADVVAYVQTLGEPQARGGNPIDQFGPIIEGIVAWLLPIPLLVLVIRLIGKRAPK